jgi:ATP-dependent Clp protease ATP-binding subunit ClpE
VGILLEDVNATLGERGLRVEVTDGVKNWLLEQAGVEPSTGARPLRRTIQRYIQDAVSDILINQYEGSVDLIEVSLEDDELRFNARTQEVLTTES